MDRLPKLEKNDTLHIHDSRTGQSYLIPIRNDTVKASDLAGIVRKPSEDDGNYPQTNGKRLRVFDPGFHNTAIMESKITLTDGEAGLLVYRGYSFIHLLENHKYDQAAFLLIWGRLSNQSEAQIFSKTLAETNQIIPNVVVDVVKSFRRDVPFIPILVAGLSAYLGSDPGRIPAVAGRNIYWKNEEEIDFAVARTFAAYTSVMSLVSCHRLEIKPGNALPHCSIAWNVLNMMGVVDEVTGEPNNDHVDVLDRFFIIALDHELTNSTAALLHAASAMADPISCLINAINSGYGILHFGAAESAFKAMRDIGTPERVPEVIQKVKAGELRLMGVGHRVYKIKDPRVELIKKDLRRLKQKGFEDPLINVAYEIERLVEHDDFFKSHRLFVNADLYWPFLFTAIGVPYDSLLPIFLTSRVVGLLAHWREAMMQPIKLWRPQQIFVGPRQLSTPDMTSTKSKL